MNTYYKNSDYIWTEYVDWINWKKGERWQLNDYSEKTHLNWQDYINKEISAWNLILFIEEWIPYIVVKAGYDKKWKLKKFSVAKWKTKEEEHLEQKTAPSKTYEELGKNTFPYNKKKNWTIITWWWNQIIKESGLISFKDDKDYIKNKWEKNEYTEFSKKVTSLNIQQTIIWNSNRRKELIKWYEVVDKANGKKRIIKAIPLNEYEEHIEKKQQPWIARIKEEYEKSWESLVNATEEYKNKVQNRLQNRLESINIIKLENAYIYFRTTNSDSYLDYEIIFKHAKILSKIEWFEELAKRAMLICNKIANEEADISNSDVLWWKVTKEMKEELTASFNWIEQKIVIDFYKKNREKAKK